MLKLRVSDLKQYIYCPRVVYFTYVCPVEKKLTRKMVYGSEAHLELDRLEKRRTFKRYNFKEGERKFHTSLYSPRLGLEGRLDMHIAAGKEIFLLNLNTARTALPLITNTSWWPMPCCWRTFTTSRYAMALSVIPVVWLYRSKLPQLPGICQGNVGKDATFGIIESMPKSQP